MVFVCGIWSIPRDRSDSQLGVVDSVGVLGFVVGFRFFLLCVCRENGES